MIDYNAKFSEILQEYVFYDLHQLEVRNLISIHKYQPVCAVCYQQVFSENEVFVNYISL